VFLRQSKKFTIAKVVKHTYKKYICIIQYLFGKIYPQCTKVLKCLEEVTG